MPGDRICIVWCDLQFPSKLPSYLHRRIAPALPADGLEAESAPEVPHWVNRDAHYSFGRPVWLQLASKQKEILTKCSMLRPVARDLHIPTGGLSPVQEMARRSLLPLRGTYAGSSPSRFLGGGSCGQKLDFRHSAEGMRLALWTTAKYASS